MKTKIKKEQLETEIELLENQIKHKRGELRHSFTSLNECDYDTNRLNQTIETSKHTMNGYLNKSYGFKANNDSMTKHPFTYDDVSKLFFNGLVKRF